MATAHGSASTRRDKSPPLLKFLKLPTCSVPEPGWLPCRGQGALPNSTLYFGLMNEFCLGVSTISSTTSPSSDTSPFELWELNSCSKGWATSQASWSHLFICPRILSCKTLLSSRLPSKTDLELSKGEKGHFCSKCLNFSWKNPDNLVKCMFVFLTEL